MPCGALSGLDLPLKDLDITSPSIKHFVDIVLDIPKDSVDLVGLQAIFRDQAWDELPFFMKPKIRPYFDTISQYMSCFHKRMVSCVWSSMFTSAVRKSQGIMFPPCFKVPVARSLGAMATRNLLGKRSSGCWNNLVELSSASMFSHLRKGNRHLQLSHLKMKVGPFFGNMVSLIRVT